LARHVTSQDTTCSTCPCILAVWSLSNSTARHARHVERVETWRDEPSGALIFNTMRWPSSNETRKYAAIRGQFRLAAHPRMRWPHLASTSVGIASVCRFRCTISHFRIHGPGIVVSNSSASCRNVTRRKKSSKTVSKFICRSYMQPQISSRYFLSKKVHAKLTQIAVRLAYIFKDHFGPLMPKFVQALFVIIL